MSFHNILDHGAIKDLILCGATWRIAPHSLIKHQLSKSIHEIPLMDISACEISHLCHWDTMELNWIYHSGLSLSARYPIAYHYYSLAIIFPLSTSIYHQTPSSQIIPWTDPNGFIPREIPRKFHGSSHLGKWLIMSLTGVRFLGPLNYSKLDSMILKNWNTSTSTDIKLLPIWSWPWCL